MGQTSNFLLTCIIPNLEIPCTLWKETGGGGACRNMQLKLDLVRNMQQGRGRN